MDTPAKCRDDNGPQSQDKESNRRLKQDRETHLPAARTHPRRTALRETVLLLTSQRLAIESSAAACCIPLRKGSDYLDPNFHHPVQNGRRTDSTQPLLN